jgi:hypothetical protein
MSSCASKKWRIQESSWWPSWKTRSRSSDCGRKERPYRSKRRIQPPLPLLSQGVLRRLGFWGQWWDCSGISARHGEGGAGGDIKLVGGLITRKASGAPRKLHLIPLTLPLSHPGEGTLEPTNFMPLPSRKRKFRNPLTSCPTQSLHTIAN